MAEPRVIHAVPHVGSPQVKFSLQNNQGLAKTPRSFLGWSRGTDPAAHSPPETAECASQSLLWVVRTAWPPKAGTPCRQSQNQSGQEATGLMLLREEPTQTEATPRALALPRCFLSVPPGMAHSSRCDLSRLSWQT